MLTDQSGARIRLAAYLGKPVVIFFYPKDGSPGCTREACSFRDDYSAFRDLGAAVLGISRDSTETHAEFRKEHDLPYPLLTDEGGRVAHDFGVPRFLGFIPGRATFVLDENGVVRMAYSNMVNTRAHSKRALEAVRSLKELGREEAPA